MISYKKNTGIEAESDMHELRKEQKQE